MDYLQINTNQLYCSYPKKASSTSKNVKLTTYERDKIIVESPPLKIISYNLENNKYYLLLELDRDDPFFIFLLKIEDKIYPILVINTTAYISTSSNEDASPNPSLFLLVEHLCCNS